MDRNWNESESVSWPFHVAQIWYKEPKFLIIITISTILILCLLGMHIYNYFHLEIAVKERTSSLTAANQELISHRTQLQKLTSELSLTEERERRRLATDLHDSISQSLSVAMMELADLTVIAKTEEIQEHTSAIQEQIKEAFQATQNLTFDLCPPELYQVGLESAIRELTVRIQKQHGIDIAFDEKGQSHSLSDDTQYVLFRSTRELLLNVIKHAHATAARVSVKKDDLHIQIRVIDDGKGFEPTNENVFGTENASFGLFSIHERVRQLGGSLAIHSKPGHGTQVTISVPLYDSAENEEEGKVS